MHIRIFFIFFLFLYFRAFCQYNPPPGIEGTSAIHKDSSVFKSWANEINIKRGKQNISDILSDTAYFGLAVNALNKAEGNSLDVVSLGDSGYAILTFPNGIRNGDGYDFAVFENSFEDNIMELAFVEVSSDGQHFSRFPNYSNIPITQQLTGFEHSDCRYVHNLAGKYRQAYGTPFNLDDINDTNVNLDYITHVKIIDVIGDISGLYSSYDYENNLINDPFPTPYPSSGFDLDAVGVINESIANINEKKKNVFGIYPNPCNDYFFINSTDVKELKIYSIDGLILIDTFVNINCLNKINITNLKKGIYIVNYNNYSFSLIKY